MGASFQAPDKYDGRTGDLILDDLMKMLIGPRSSKDPSNSCLCDAETIFIYRVPGSDMSSVASSPCDLDHGAPPPETFATLAQQSQGAGGALADTEDSKGLVGALKRGVANNLTSPRSTRATSGGDGALNPVLKVARDS